MEHAAPWAAVNPAQILVRSVPEMGSHLGSRLRFHPGGVARNRIACLRPCSSLPESGGVARVDQPSERPYRARNRGSGILAVPPTFSARNWLPVANPMYCVLSIM